MPAKTKIQEVQTAVGLKSVRSHLADYAVGVLIYEQSTYKKNQAKEKRQASDKINRLDINSSEKDNSVGLEEASNSQLDLGFYYTLLLFDQLAETHPIEVKKMIEAVLSFDTFGRYLLQKEPVIVDGIPFDLELFLQKHQINVEPLISSIRLNRDNSVAVSEEVCLLPPRTAAKPIAFTLPVEGDYKLRKSPLGALEKQARRVKEMETFCSLLKDISLNYDLISQWPTEHNIHHFLSILAELFAHAKMQDSVKLDTINVWLDDHTKRAYFSSVALLQNLIGEWMILSLLQAPTSELFEIRIKFLVEAFVTVNKKLPGLPIYATADMYLPFISFSQFVHQSNLKRHPTVQCHLSVLLGFENRHNAMALTQYTNKIKVVLGKKKVSLAPMRMLMTTKLAWASELLTFFDERMAKKFKGKSTEKIEKITLEEWVKEAIKRGEVVYDYFNPKRALLNEPLSKMSLDCCQFFNQIPELESISKMIDFFHMIELVSVAFPLYEETKDIDEQLKVLESSLVGSFAKIYFFPQPGARLCSLTNQAAIDFIERQVNCIKMRIEGDESLDETYQLAVVAWCSDILRQAVQLRPPRDFDNPCFFKHRTSTSPGDRVDRYFSEESRFKINISA